MFVKKQLLTEILILSAITAVFHKMALVLYLYWTTSWFDLIMHTLGGILVGLIAGFIFYVTGFVKIPNRHYLNSFLIITGSVLIVGLIWELWEIFTGMTNVLSDEIDTIFDVVMDLVGASIAFLYIKNKLWKN